ncbi:MAG TPA: hypothetical protein VGB13_03990 [Candidatus Krumholzibacteria bacterium]
MGDGASNLAVLSAPGDGTPKRHGDQWGGYILVRRDSRTLHAILTGRLSEASLGCLHRAIQHLCPMDGPRFLLLDGSHLHHIPLAVAEMLATWDERCCACDVVPLWTGLSPYLRDILSLAQGAEEGMPSFPRFGAALKALQAVSADSAAMARLRLGAWGAGPF